MDYVFHVEIIMTLFKEIVYPQVKIQNVNFQDYLEDVSLAIIQKNIFQIIMEYVHLKILIV
jgi:hypothetical protein